MAPLKNAIFAAFALASVTSAVPLALDRRAAVTNTVTETTWTTVDVTKTVYAGELPTTEVTADTTAPAPAAATTPVEAPPAKVEQPVEQPAVAANFAEQPQSVSAAPAAASTPSTSVAAPAAATSPASGSSDSSSGSSSGATYTGDFTYYEGGLGACGWNVDTASEDAIALPHGMMGAQSNGNPYCGKTVIITSPETGKEFPAKVSDKCMGCEGSSIDATDALFKKVAPNGDGRVKNVSWRFAD